MKIKLITIGNELLSGFTVDTNATWIGQELGKIGLSVSSRLTIGDNSNEIIKLLEDSINEDVLIVTGGLGPTHDDITTSAFFKYFNDTPEFSEEYWQYLTERFKKITSKVPNLNRNQALSSTKGEMIPNPVGSARGLHYKTDTCHYFALPGVPKEMKAMMTETILPFLKEKSSTELIIRTLRTTGIPESALAEQVQDIIEKYSNITVAFLPQLIGVDIRLTGHSSEEVETIQSSLEQRLGKLLFGYENDTLEDVVGRLLNEKGLTLSTAESCTGGLLSHRITNSPGSSTYFKGGVISYSNEVKMNILEVEEDTLERVGAVSEQTAIEMAEGVQKLLKSDMGVSITGIAGPDGGSAEKPVGLVYIGFVYNHESYAKKFQFIRDRKGNKYLSSQAALNMIRLNLSK